ncbi:MAG: hypothetical protein KME12_09640 [Trichocoleus desertorum ATA4-8-CV12]|jgi:hypothetical protein|nr:hypothetical protein [Trichocoleus desertorum ATA4-8-CV12]
MFSKLSGVGIAIALSTITLNSHTRPAQAVTLVSSSFSPTATPPDSLAKTTLASYLTQANIKVYGAYNCPFTLMQRQLFGEEAFKQVHYIECHANGKNAQPNLCQSLQIKQTPTWEINGHFYSGVRSLEQLARISKYRRT